MFSSNTLTSRQTEILKFIQEFQNNEGTSPTYREITGFFGFRSPKAAVDHVHALEKKGYVRRHSGRSRGIELLNSGKSSKRPTSSVPILGSIPAGSPEIQTEQNLGTLAIDEEILCKSAGHRLFALRVDGESMEGRGIHKGDWVIADADISPHEGNVVVALIDGKNTLKTLAKQKGRFFLKSENPSHKDRVPVEELIIQGVVKVIFRRLD